MLSILIRRKGRRIFTHGSSKKKKKGRDDWGYENAIQPIDDSGYGASQADAEDFEIALNYDEAKTNETSIDLARIERGWEAYNEVKDLSVLNVNDLVTWKVSRSH